MIVYHALANTIVANDIILHVNEVNVFFLDLLMIGKKSKWLSVSAKDVCGYINFALRLSHSR